MNGHQAQARFVRNLRARGVTVLTLRQWGTKMPGVYAERLLTHPVAVKKADTLVEHITVTFDDGVLVGDFKKDMQEVERIGWQRFGSGFSYNLGLDPVTGMVGMGMPFFAKGTHTINRKKVPGFTLDQNDAARAVAVLGMPGVKLSRRAIEAHAKIIASMVDVGLLTTHFDFVPHSLFAAKDCPTDNVREVMPVILRRAKRISDKF